MNFKAFTLIEVLVVVALIGILSAFVLPTVGNFNEVNVASQTIQNIASDVESLKFKAISGVTYNGTLANWAILPICTGNNNTYSLRAYTVTLPSASIAGSIVVRTLPAGFKFTTSSDTSPTSCGVLLSFKRISGSVASTGTFPFTIAIKSTKEPLLIKKITIDVNGSITYN